MGSIPIARSNSFKGLGQGNSEPESCASAECPRNLFCTRSGQDPLLCQDTSEGGRGASGECTNVPYGNQTAPKIRVRGRCTAAAVHRDYQDPAEGLAHPSNRLVAQLNESWRVVDDQLQWRLQRKKGNSRKKNSGWRDRSFCTTREGLLRCIREHGGKVGPAALAALSALPQHHASIDASPPLRVCGHWVHSCGNAD